ncbi:calcium-binding protein [uncultured Mameliella sp.]|uniref:calcium-binding protein n=1 Tax=uncultured Mameliella sp. TaxID=1447087 RepID=UPI00260386FF|nr:calcium-binding protein [uncultured Mameliella sp.]
MALTAVNQNSTLLAHLASVEVKDSGVHIGGGIYLSDNHDPHPGGTYTAVPRQGLTPPGEAHATTEIDFTLPAGGAPWQAYRDPNPGGTDFIKVGFDASLHVGARLSDGSFYAGPAVPLLIAADPDDLSGTVTVTGYPDGPSYGGALYETSGALLGYATQTVNGDTGGYFTIDTPDVVGGMSGGGNFLDYDADGDGTPETYLIGLTSRGVRVTTPGPSFGDIRLQSTALMTFYDELAAHLLALSGPEARGAADFPRMVLLSGQAPGSAFTTLQGEFFHEDLYGGPNDDSLMGAGGNDLLLGRDGDDTLQGGTGDDTLDGGEGSDNLIGGVGDDRLIGGPGAETLDGSPGGRDTISYAQATSSVILRLANNTVTGDPLAQGDTILNFENAETGEGDDQVFGNFMDNTLAGNGGADTIFGYGGADVLLGGAGHDRLIGDQGDDSLLGGAGDDWLLGSGGNDTLYGGEGSDSLIGGVGDDVLIGGPGAETLDGSPGGSDTIDYAQATSGMILRLWNNTVTGDPLAQGDTILNFENAETGEGDDLIAGNHRDNRLTGNGGNDRLFGYGGADVLQGGAGSDLLRGGAGADRLSGGADRDFLTGGADADVFLFASAAEAGLGAARDQIMDFQPGLDLVDVSALAAFGFRGTAGFTASGPAELRLRETPTGSTIVQMDLDGDGIPDAEIRLADVTGLGAADFML